MNITEGRFYECRDGEGYIYVKERDEEEISYAHVKEPTSESLKASGAFTDIVGKEAFEDKIVYPYCECKGYTAWSDIPMDIHEACSIYEMVTTIKEQGYPNKEVEKLCNIICGILDRGHEDEYEDSEYEA